MTEYYPDKWILVEISDYPNKPIRKVLASWYGGYLGNNSWRISSSIVKIEEDEINYTFFTESGSYYICDKENYGMSAYTVGVLKELTEHAESNNFTITRLDFKDIRK